MQDIFEFDSQDRVKSISGWLPHFFEMRALEVMSSYDFLKNSTAGGKKRHRNAENIINCEHIPIVLQFYQAGKKSSLVSGS